MSPRESPAGLLTHAVEAFARELLALVRGVRVYPPSHPYLQGVVARLLAGVESDLPAALSLGVTPSELWVGEVGAGGKGTRAAQLAALLHGKKALRVRWAPTATADDALAFAAALADPALEGPSLGAALVDRGVGTIEVASLNLACLHDTFAEAGGVGGKEAWQWLLAGGALFSGTAGEADGASLVRGVAALGGGLGEALEALPEEQRAGVLARLARLGGEARASDLAAVLRGADLSGPVVSALTPELTGDRLVELLAALAAAEGKNTQRLADVFRRFAPPGGATELLPTVRARIADAGLAPRASGVWQAVETFLLELDEESFMEAEYTASLDRLAARGPDGTAPPGEVLDLLEDPEAHLDRVLLALAVREPETWGPRLGKRLETRVTALQPTRYLELLQTIHGAVPGFLERRPEVLVRALRDGSERLRDLDRAGRDQLLAFACAHEAVLLEPVLRALATEQRIAVRRFLVDVLSAYSPAATPVLVARLRRAPWYVTRNLTIALGRRGDQRALPAVRALRAHEHPKVRREAVLALASLEARAEGGGPP